MIKKISKMIVLMLTLLLITPGIIYCVDYDGPMNFSGSNADGEDLNKSNHHTKP